MLALIFKGQGQSNATHHLGFCEKSEKIAKGHQDGAGDKNVEMKQ